MGDRVSLCSIAWPETHYVDQTDFKLTEIRLTDSYLLRIKVCATMTGLVSSTLWKRP